MNSHVKLESLYFYYTIIWNATLCRLLYIAIAFMLLWMFNFFYLSQPAIRLMLNQRAAASFHQCDYSSSLMCIVNWNDAYIHNYFSMSLSLYIITDTCINFCIIIIYTTLFSNLYYSLCILSCIQSLYIGRYIYKPYYIFF